MGRNAESVELSRADLQCGVERDAFGNAVVQWYQEWDAVPSGSIRGGRKISAWGMKIRMMRRSGAGV